MSRRKFLSWLGGGTLAACAPARISTIPETAAATADPPRVRAVAFDLFTLFDPRGIDRRVSEVVGDQLSFAATWKAKLFQYSWLRALSGQYVDFERLVRDALMHAARAHQVTLTEAEHAQLASALTELEPWPDSAAALDRLRQQGLKLAPLANFTPGMIERLLEQGGLRDRFHAILSTDQARTYKPDPRAYGLAEATLGLPRRQIAFSAFGGWDAAGARWFGLPTFWVNRLALPSEELAMAHATGPDLNALVRWIESDSAESSLKG